MAGAFGSVNVHELVEAMRHTQSITPPTIAIFHDASRTFIQGRLRAVFSLLVWCATALTSVESSAVDLRNVWLLESGEVAVEMFDCNGLLCGRIVWVRPEGTSVHASGSTEQLSLCNQAVVQRLRPAGPNRWEDGSLYDPRDGRTYSFILRSQSADVLLARAYIGLPAFGESQILRRVRDLPRQGWCVPPTSIESAEAVSAMTR